MKKLNKQSHYTPPRPDRIIQFGAGNFLRGFIDWIVAHLNQKTEFNGNVVVIKPTPTGNYKALRDQDGLFHTVLSGFRDGAAFEEIKLIDCISTIIHPYDEFSSFLRSAEIPDLNIIISNTTESGINFLEEANNPHEAASTFPGKLTQWLHHRFEVLGNNNSGCTILPCELIEDNAQRLQDCILQYANHWELDESFKVWLNQENQFCNTLVDRIVTGYPQKTAALIEERIGYHDGLLVAGEYYHNWVIEGPTKLLQTLPFDQTDLGIQLVDDLQIHRNIKVRILNGLHTAMVPVGYLNGQRTVGEVMQDTRMIKYLEELLTTEILPTIKYNEENLRSYADAILERFRNPAIQHNLSSIALNSISKFSTRLLPTLLDHSARTQSNPPHICRALAALLLFYRGSWEDQSLPVQDDADICAFILNEWQMHEEGKQSLESTVHTLLSQKSFWHEDLSLLKDLQFDMVDMIKSILHQHDIFA